MKRDELDLVVIPGNGDLRISLPGGHGNQRNFGPVKRATLQAYLELLADSIKSLSDAASVGPLSPELRQILSEDIASAGLRLAHVVFGERSEEFVRFVIDSGAKRLQLVCLDEMFSLPWDFLAFIVDRKQVYLGQIATVTPAYDDYNSRAWFGDEFRDIVGLSDTPVGLVEDDLLASACIKQKPNRTRIEEEVHALVPVAGSTGAVDIFGALDKSLGRAQEVSKFRAWLEKARRIVHFNCHGELPPRGASGYPTLRVSDSFKLEKNDIADPLKKPTDLNFALVVLNVCNSAIGRHSSRRTLSQLFHDQSASAAVCTTGAVADDFATDFANEFYARLASSDLITAILETRRALLRKHTHPMALMYTFTGDGSFRPTTL